MAVTKINRMIITGGGTGGHVFPAIRIAKAFQRSGTDILYIGSFGGMENQICKESNIRFYPISTGKLRRYFSWWNFIDPFKIIVGIIESLLILRKFEPDVVFSKGGYVSFPVVLSAWLLNIPLVLHESDITPGLSNKIMMRFADKICLSFEESLKIVNSKKAIFTGNPIRDEFFHGDKKKAKLVAGFSDVNDNLPVIMFLGGSLGALEINDMVKNILGDLVEFSNVVLQCGKGKLIDVPENLKYKDRFFQVEFLGVRALASFYKLADVIVSRSGAGQISELAFLGKPSILIPLSLEVSRGDQIQNARLLQHSKASVVLDREDNLEKIVIKNILNIINNESYRNKLITNIQKFYNKNSVRDIMKIVKDVVKK